MNEEMWNRLCERIKVMKSRHALLLHKLESHEQRLETYEKG